MQAAFLISVKDFNEKQIGILFLVFGMSQFLCMAPAGYFLDYSNRKIDWVVFAGAAASTLTVLTAITAEQEGKNMGLMIFWKILQGGVTAILPPGYNGITLGIVGSTGFTHQVSRNRMMNHMGTALIVASGSLLAYFLYPNIGALFLVSPLAAMCMAYNLRRIKPKDVDRDAARGLIIESPTMNEYENYDEEEEDAAVAAAALSWHMMEDDADSNLEQKKDRGKQIIHQLSTASYTPRTAPNNNMMPGISNPNPAYFPRMSDITATNSNDQQPAGSTAVVVPLPTNSQSQPAVSPSTLSATSSAYMPPDILSAPIMGGGSQQGAVALHDRNIMVLTSPIHEHEEGFRVPSTSELRQRPTSPLQQSNNNLRSDSSTNVSNNVSYGPQLWGRNQTEDSRAGRVSVKTYDSGPSFNLGYLQAQQAKPAYTANSSAPLEKSHSQQKQDEEDTCYTDPTRKARTPLAVLMDPTLMMFAAVIFFFHMANSSVLPLVMQSLALEDAQSGILLSGLCILIAQAFMSYFAKVCGDYTPIWGRKNLLLVGLAALTVRCFLLTALVSADEAYAEEGGSKMLKTMILSTQLLDAIGAGILGCLHILVTNDISGGTGRFSLMLGVTTGAMCLGGTVSGYIGQAIAHDYGYPMAFLILGIMSLVPFFLYAFFMPETLPDYAKPNQQTFKKRRKRIAALFKKLA